MKAPDKIYIQTYAGETFSSKWTTIPFRDFENTEYIRKDVVDEMIKTAEDHAYFAGQEKLREKLMEWAKAEKGKCSDETHPYAMFMNVLIKQLNSF